MSPDDWIIVEKILSGFGVMVCLALLWHARITRYADKLAQELPKWDWLTVSQLAERGYRRGRCIRALPYLHRRGLLDVRLDTALTPEQREKVRTDWEQGGVLYFTELTAPYCEFSLTRRGGGRGRRIQIRFPSFNLGWAPMLAPVPVRR